MSVKGDKTKCKHPERACKYCFECDNEITEGVKMKTITKTDLFTAILLLKNTTLSVNEQIIYAALRLKSDGNVEFDYQASEILKQAYRHEEVRINLNYSYEGC